MKKLYAVVFLLIATTLVGCGTQNLEVNEAEMTGESLEITGENSEMTGDEVLLEVTEEDMEDFDATEVTKVEGSDEIENDEDAKKVTEEVDKLIEERKTQPTDDAKLNEEDIDVFENVIEIIKNIGS